MVGISPGAHAAVSSSTIAPGSLRQLLLPFSPLRKRLSGRIEIPRPPLRTDPGLKFRREIRKIGLHPSGILDSFRFQPLAGTQFYRLSTGAAVRPWSDPHVDRRSNCFISRMIRTIPHSGAADGYGSALTVLLQFPADQGSVLCPFQLQFIMQGKRSLPTSNIRRLFPFRCRAGRRWDYNLCHCRQSGLCAHGQSVLPGTDIVIFSIQRQFLPLSLQTDRLPSSVISQANSGCSCISPLKYFTWAARVWLRCSSVSSTFPRLNTSCTGRCSVSASGRYSRCPSGSQASVPRNRFRTLYCTPLSSLSKKPVAPFFR